MSQVKNKSLEGLRGWAAAMVVLSHLVFTFWPASQTGNPADSVAKFDLLVFNSPLSFIYGGTFAVCLFFVMSGYVLTIKFARTGDPDVVRALFIKRYFRLMPPVLLATLASYVVLRGGLMTNGDAPLSWWYRGLYHFEPRLADAVADGLYRSFIFQDHAAFDPPLWTMRIEFLGSLLCFSWCLMTSGMSFRALADTLLIATLISALGPDGVYLSLFVIGAWIARGETHNLGLLRSVTLFALGVWMGGYHPTSSFHAPLTFFASIFGTPVWNAMSRATAAVLIFFMVLNSPAVSRYFARFDKFGARSFSLYLVHFPILAILGGITFVLARSQGMNYPLASLLSCLTVALFSYAVAIAFHRFVDAPAIRFSAWILRCISPAADQASQSRSRSAQV